MPSSRRTPPTWAATRRCGSSMSTSSSWRVTRTRPRRTPASRRTCVSAGPVRRTLRDSWSWSATRRRTACVRGCGKTFGAVGKNLRSVGAKPGDSPASTPGGPMLVAAQRHAVVGLALGAALATVGTVGLASPASAHGYRNHPSHAVFVQTDDPAGNTVVAYHRDGDGTLTQAGSYPTGGLGGVLTGSVVDHLASKDHWPWTGPTAPCTPSTPEVTRSPSS